jgi:SAM-dependent methyltransferase
MSGRDMGRFWDERAREDAMFFVDDREPYGNADADRFWAQGERDLDHILSTLGTRIASGDSVVDVGCGVGRLTRVIARRARQVYAVDVSAEMLTLARVHNGELDNVRWIHGDGATLRPIPDAAADAVVSHVVFQHIPDPAIVLGYVREMGRVLRPGGWAAFQVSNDPTIHLQATYGGSRGRVRGFLVGRLGRGPKGQDDPAWLGSAVDLDELTAAAEGAGMTIERVEGAGTQFCLIRARRVQSL